MTSPLGDSIEFYRWHLNLDVEKDKSIQRVQKKVFAEEDR